jgi:hypothetical protein
MTNPNDLIRRGDAAQLAKMLARGHIHIDAMEDEINAIAAAVVTTVNEEQNTEQRKAFWNWLPLAYRDGHIGEEPKFTKYNMEVAHYAGWCAAPDTPEVLALVEALDNLLEAITAENQFHDRSLTITGPTVNLKWLLEAEDEARAAIAAWEASRG